MIHEQVRAARIEHGLSQAKLAKLAGVPRERVRKLENGENVTVKAFEKIVAQLPNLKELTVGGVHVRVTGIDVEAVRAAIVISDAANRRLLALLDTIAVHAPEPPAGATRVEPSARVRPELEARLAELEAQVRALQAAPPPNS